MSPGLTRAFSSEPFPSTRHVAKRAWFGKLKNEKKSQKKSTFNTLDSLPHPSVCMWWWIRCRDRQTDPPQGEQERDYYHHYFWWLKQRICWLLFMVGWNKHHTRFTIKSRTLKIHAIYSTTYLHLSTSFHTWIILWSRLCCLFYRSIMHRALCSACTKIVLYMHCTKNWSWLIGKSYIGACQDNQLRSVT